MGEIADAINSANDSDLPKFLRGKRGEAIESHAQVLSTERTLDSIQLQFAAAFTAFCTSAGIDNDTVQGINRLVSSSESTMKLKKSPPSSSKSQSVLVTEPTPDSASSLIEAESDEQPSASDYTEAMKANHTACLEKMSDAKKQDLREQGYELARKAVGAYPDHPKVLYFAAVLTGSWARRVSSLEVINEALTCVNNMVNMIPDGTPDTQINKVMKLKMQLALVKREIEGT